MSETAAPSAPAPAAPSTTNSAPVSSSTPSTPSASATKPDFGLGASDPTPPAPEPKVEVPAAPEKRKFKLKVHGKEQELELTDAEIALRLQKDEAAEIRMQRAAEMEKKALAREELLKKDPLKALKDEYKIEDLDTRLEDYLAEKYKLEMMSAEERKQLEITKELERYRNQEKERQEQALQVQRQAEVDKVYADKERLYTESLKKLGMQGDMEMLAMMAQLDLQILQANEGLDPSEQFDLTPDQLAAEVKARLDKPATQYKAKLEKLEGEELLKELGQAAVDKVLKASLARLGTKAATKALDPNPPKPAPKVEDEPPRNQGNRANADAFWRKVIHGND